MRHIRLGELLAKANEAGVLGPSPTAAHLAIDLILLDSQKNRYLPNGHNYQTERLPIYLPGNGGLLTTVAMMAGGWEGHSGSVFPEGWHVEYEGLHEMI